MRVENVGVQEKYHFSPCIKSVNLFFSYCLELNVSVNVSYLFGAECDIEAEMLRGQTHRLITIETRVGQS